MRMRNTENRIGRGDCPTRPESLAVREIAAEQLIDPTTERSRHRFVRGLMEAGLDNGEIIIETRRSAQMPNVIQQSIHETFLLLTHNCKVRDTTSQIPHLMSLAKDLKDAIAEDQ
jgi:hypothetical protein